MDDPRLQDLKALLVATAHAHHAVYGGARRAWARWYAEWMYGQLLALLESAPSVDTVESWLTRADTRYTTEKPEGSWPRMYATWLLEWDGDAAATEPPPHHRRPLALHLSRSSGWC